MKKMFWIPLGSGLACLLVYVLAVLITFSEIANRGIIGGAGWPTVFLAAQQWAWIAWIAAFLMIEALVIRIVQAIKERKQ